MTKNEAILPGRENVIHGLGIPWNTPGYIVFCEESVESFGDMDGTL